MFRLRECNVAVERVVCSSSGEEDSLNEGWML